MALSVVVVVLLALYVVRAWSTSRRAPRAAIRESSAPGSAAASRARRSARRQRCAQHAAPAVAAVAVVGLQRQIAKLVPEAQAGRPPGLSAVKPDVWVIAAHKLGDGTSSAEIAAYVDRLWARNAHHIASGSPDVSLRATSSSCPEAQAAASPLRAERCRGSGRRPSGQRPRTEGEGEPVKERGRQPRHQPLHAEQRVELPGVSRARTRRSARAPPRACGGPR